MQTIPTDINKAYKSTTVLIFFWFDTRWDCEMFDFSPSRKMDSHFLPDIGLATTKYIVPLAAF